MVSDTRAYFDNIIKTCVPGIERWPDDLFGNNPLNEAVVDKYYKIIFGAIDSNRNGLEWSDNLPVTVEIFKSLDRDREAGFDILYDRAIDIQRAIIDPRNIELGNFANDIEALQIIPAEEDTNDNTIKMVLSFNVVEYYLFNS
jgi:hypothetical protein